ncbi:hypothetical protein TNCV_3888631 [Trichonephila clavipes]|nr:hypothetical protein TNCV_3888631 [Trichonephila clavipes]
MACERKLIESEATTGFFVLLGTKGKKETLEWCMKANLIASRYECPRFKKICVCKNERERLTATNGVAATSRKIIATTLFGVKTSRNLDEVRLGSEIAQGNKSSSTENHESLVTWSEMRNSIICPFRMLLVERVSISNCPSERCLKKKCNPVDDESDEDEDNSNNKSSKGPPMLTRFLRLRQLWSETSNNPTRLMSYSTTTAQENQRSCSEKTKVYNGTAKNK